MAEEGVFPQTLLAGEVVDIQFALMGEEIPADYADLLLGAVQTLLPWLAEDAVAGIHPISGLSPGDGVWYLSRRSRLSLRIPRERFDDARAALAGACLALLECKLDVGAATLRDLVHSPVIYSKFVAFEPARASSVPVTEDEFLDACQDCFSAMDIHPQLVCGKSQRALTPEGMLSGFSLLLAGLEPNVNLYLQHFGIGIERKRGCGIFVPHKSFATIRTLE